MTTPPIGPPDVATPNPADVAAQEAAAVDSQLKQLAAELAKMAKLPFDPATFRKALIAAVNDTSSPPTVSLTISGDTQTLVSEVRLLNNYTPLVGQTVLLAKQGSEIFILGSIAATTPMGVNNTTDNGWKRAPLTSGSHGGNGNGDVYYRRIMDNGSWKMQWRGGWSVSGTTMISASPGLDADYRPSSKRSVMAAREISGGSVAVQFDFHTNGSITLVGGTTAPAGNGASTGTDFQSPGVFISVGVSGATGGGGVDGHAHAFSGSGSGSGSAGHSHNVFTHTHGNSVNSPGWVSLNGVEYFL